MLSTPRPVRWIPPVRPLLLSALIGALAPATALAEQATERLFINPTVLGGHPAPPPGGGLENNARVEGGAAPANALVNALGPVAPLLPHSGSERRLDLYIRYTRSAIYNPATGLNDAVYLRSYTGGDVDPTTPFVAPTIEATPGDTVRITLHNRLPEDPTCPSTSGISTPHCFNTTNLHSHGLWVSPTGNSDNVLLAIRPQSDFQYEYNIPADHPAGTFWYHPHEHGSTALQVSSGMAGALIIRGDRAPTTDTRGDLDTLLYGPAANGGWAPVHEDLLVFQQVTYYCLYGDNKQPQTVKSGPREGQTDWSCPAGKTGIIESYNQMAPGDWAGSGRYTSINGTVLPTFNTIKAGEAVRWRLVHAGIRDTINFQLRALAADAPATITDTSKCTGPVLPVQVVAADGLTMEQAQKRQITTLQPGYRNDLLVVFPRDGRYCVINTPRSAPASVAQKAEDAQLLATVTVAPGTNVAVEDIPARLVKLLTAAAQRPGYLPSDVQATVVADLEGRASPTGSVDPKKILTLRKFIPHPSIADSEVTGHQELVFFIDVNTSPAQFQVGKSFATVPQFGPGPAPETVRPAGARAFDPGVIDRELPLGEVDEWELRSYFVSHPFHIHVNPFQVVRILGPDGKDVSDPDAIDQSDKLDTQYAGLKGVWKDTLWVKSLITTTKGGMTMEAPKGVYKVFIRTRYERYIGQYVLHCHILDHEDQGMMENVAIELTDKSGTPVKPGHAH